MKFMKYPLMVIAIVAIIAVIFWDDIKKLFNKAKDMQIFKTFSNNPFNIKANKANDWKGKTTKEGDKFESFDTPINGIRAGIKLLKTYFSKYHLNTVEGIIKRYAPPSENDTAGYIQFVCDEMQVSSNQELSPDKETLFSLCKAICKMENGYNLKREDYEAAHKLI